MWIVIVSFLAAVPLLALKVIYLSDVQGWDNHLAFGLTLPVLAIVGLGWPLYLITECVLRSIHPRTTRLSPWFSAVAFISLMAFIFAGELARPIVLLNPNWCRVYQVIQWEHISNGSYTLVTVGKGNLMNHETNSAYLNWPGDESAGLSNIHFSSFTFSWWDNNDQVASEGTFDTLYERIARSGLPENELQILTAEIWGVLQQVQHGRPISAPNAKIEPMVEAPFGDEHTYIGGMAWMAVVTLLFLIVGTMTLYK